jgi:hypothetical protein
LQLNTRPIVKDHTSLVLRAENVSTKYEWIQRMMRAVAAAAGPPPPPAAAAAPAAPPAAAPGADGAAAANGGPAPAALGAADAFLDPVTEGVGAIALERRNSFEVRVERGRGVRAVACGGARSLPEDNTSHEGVHAHARGQPHTLHRASPRQRTTPPPHHPPPPKKRR